MENRYEIYQREHFDQGISWCLDLIDSKGRTKIEESSPIVPITLEQFVDHLVKNHAAISKQDNISTLPSSVYNQEESYLDKKISDEQLIKFSTTYFQTLRDLKLEKAIGSRNLRILK